MSQLYKQQVHLHLGWLTRVDDESEDEPSELCRFHFSIPAF